MVASLTTLSKKIDSDKKILNIKANTSNCQHLDYQTEICEPVALKLVVLNASVTGSVLDLNY